MDKGLLTQTDGRLVDLNPHDSSPPMALNDCISLPMDADIEQASYESDTDDGEDAILPQSLLNDAQRERARNAAFEDVIRQKDETALQELAERVKELPANDSNASDSATDTRIIDRVRDYQSELFARAKAGNIIAVLETGSGKTLIAALLLRDTVTKEMEDRAAGKPPRTSFFLVNSVALAEQQFQMLCQNLATSPALVHGRTMDAWRREDWRKLFDSHQVVVCTAQVLYQCLNQPYIKIEEINLIIFDEAHHVKKEHPYARIIKDHYLHLTKASARPRIFGATASPVDGKGDVLEAAHMLESLLDAKIATTKSLSLHIHAPKAAVLEWEFDKLSDPFETALSRQLSFCRDLSVFDSHFKDAKSTAASLGPWCADQIWRYVLEEQQVQKVLEGYERREPSRDGIAENGMSTVIERLRQAEDIVRRHYFPEAQPTREFLSSKVLLLYEKLLYYFEDNENTRCLIFVDRRITARVLLDLFSSLEIRNLRPGIFIGVGGSRSGQAGVTGLQIRDLKSRFQSGLVNCLFCTSVAEEGIDSPGCNLVVRFDLYNTMIQYVQSRGRARARGSIYGQMIERGNPLHKVRVDDAHYHELQLRQFLSNLEEDRFLENDIVGIHGAFHKEKPNKTFGTQAGARCNYRTSILYLDRYASSLQYENHGQAQVIYEPEIAEGMFRFRTILPDGSPVKGALGESFPNKSVAKQSAAWETCYVLRARGLLDENLNSVYFKQRPKNANSRLAVSSFKKDEYDMRVKPAYWKVGYGELATSLFATVIILHPSARLTRVHDPLVLLTRSPLPPLPAFPVYLESNIETEVVFTQWSSSYAVDEKSLSCLRRFTLQFFHDLFNKEYEAEDTQMPYWLVPTKWRPGDDRPQKLGDFVEVDPASDHGRVDWSPGSDPQRWCEQFLIDKWSGKYRYWSKDVLDDRTVDSLIPPDVPDRRSKGTKATKVLEYTLSLYGSSKSSFLENSDRSQPVIEAELIQHRCNFLDRASTEELEGNKPWYHVCPEPLAISMLPHGFVSSALVFPAILSRVDSYLIATEACQKLQLEIPPELALEAMTKDSDNTEEHREQQIHFQRGMGKNYERLEFLGDAFLKMTTSIMVFIRHPKSDEEGFHVKRMEMICNLNLFNVAVDPSIELFEYIRSKGFNRRFWYPEGMILKRGKGALHASMQPVKHEIPKHALAPKTIADVSEAIIGAALLSAKSSDDYDMAIRAVTKLVNSPDHSIMSWSDYSRLYSPPSWSLETTPDGFTFGSNNAASKIQERMGYAFRHPRLLRSAMTHPSYISSNVPDYQRLEFLGDAILDMVCIRNLYDRYPDRDPQWLTEHKMAMVSNKFLGAVAVDLEFDKYLYSTGVHIPAQISGYAYKIREQLADAKANNRLDFWTEIEDPPKCLSDAVESYIGAVFVDSDFNLGEVERFYHRHLHWYFSDMAVYDSFANKQPTTELHNLLTKQFACRDHKLIVSEPRPHGPPTKPTMVITAGVLIHGAVVTDSTKTSAKSAKVRASTDALGLVRGLAREEFRSRFKCRC